MKKLLIIVLILAVFLVRGGILKNKTQLNKTQSVAVQTTPVAPSLVLPIDSNVERISKKFSGTYVTPQNSPVSPERFKGYHNGLDFETFSNEKNIDVSIKAICSGPLVFKRMVSGYGGVAIQRCKINSQDVTVLYGHIRLSSIAYKINAQLKAGDTIGVLGTGYSSETDGERKHLHLGIHKGTAINLAGYVQDKSQLIGWLDPREILQIK
jgi:murein DD-endopeptidase MepM/ murein hydrolase activator NlpD